MDINDVNIVRQLNIDFHDSKYISINAKQHDIASRYVLVSCYHQKAFLPIDNVTNCAYVRYRKADENDVFNICEITDDGKILVELTPQMLAVEGRCYADLIVINNATIEVDDTTNEPYVKDSNVVSTMTFCVNVLENAVDHDVIESSYEFNALNELLIKANADYTVIVTECRKSEKNAKESEINAKESEVNSKESEINSKESEVNSKTSENNSKMSEINSKVSETNAKKSEVNAKKSEETSVTYGTMSKSYAVGETGTRENEDVDNTKYYYSKVKNMSETLGGLFIPKGTIKFSELLSVAKESGYVYHISEDFVSDETFKDGGGVSYTAGTNVYCTSDGYWDCFTGGNLTVIDDDNGNVEFLYASTLVDANTVQALMNRIEELEQQVVLGIVE